MGRMPRAASRAVAPAFLGLFLALAGVAQAEQVTLGPTDLQTGPFVSSHVRYTYVQAEDSKRFTLAAPGNGFITTWRVQQRYAGQVRLLVMKPQSDGSYATDFTGQAQSGKSGLNTFSETLPVPAGDVIGLQLVGA